MTINKYLFGDLDNNRRHINKIIFAGNLSDNTKKRRTIEYVNHCLNTSNTDWRQSKEGLRVIVGDLIYKVAYNPYTFREVVLKNATAVDNLLERNYGFLAPSTRQMVPNNINKGTTGLFYLCMNRYNNNFDTLLRDETTIGIIAEAAILDLFGIKYDMPELSDTNIKINFPKHNLSETVTSGYMSVTAANQALLAYVSKGRNNIRIIPSELQTNDDIILEQRLNSVFQDLSNKKHLCDNNTLVLGAAHNDFNPSNIVGSIFPKDISNIKIIDAAVRSINTTINSEPKKYIVKRAFIDMDPAFLTLPYSTMIGYWRGFNRKLQEEGSGHSLIKERTDKITELLISKNNLDEMLMKIGEDVFTAASRRRAYLKSKEEKQKNKL